ncbi:MAG: nucleoside-triphosphatase [Elusimicrobiota bacterium]
MATKTGEKNALVWRKAAVLGSLWAASEIVLGSFLHNARVPFSGEFLTAVGIAVLVAGHRLWPERGLLWRAGLVCAAMKSVSPSAVIFGPMAAIAAEGLLAEAGVRLLGGNAAGYLLAGALAMLGTLGYKLLRLFMLYGPDTIKVYLRGVEWLKGLGLAGAGPWAPLIAAACAYFIGGAAVALAGMSAGEQHAPAAGGQGAKVEFKRPGAEGPARSYSVWTLLLHALFVAGVMAAGRGIPAAALLATAVIYGYLCARFYPRARRLLKHTGVWTGVAIASAAAGFMLGSVEAGLYMALRAFLLTLAFAAIGCELLNPAIRGLLERLAGRVFFETLEYAFSALPGIIAGLPSGRAFVRRPLAALGTAVARAPFLLDKAEGPRVFIITGGHGAGKSELVLALAVLLRRAGRRPGGICSTGLWENGRRSGFDVLDLASGARQPLCRRGPGGGVRAGEFGFFNEGLAAGLKALSAESLAGADAVFVDEAGFLELEGGGWAAPIEELCRGGHPLVLVVRDYLVERLTAHFKLRRPVLWRAGETSAGAALPELLAAIRAELS